MVNGELLIVNGLATYPFAEEFSTTPKTSTPVILSAEKDLCLRAY